MTTSFVSSTTTPVVTQSTQLARIDADAVTRQAMESNSQALAAYLRAVAPSMPTVHNDVVDTPPRGVAAPHEAHERSNRFRWTLIAIVCLSIVATGGLAFTAYQVGAIQHVGLAISVWIFTGGSLAIWLVHRLQVRDMAYSPEAIALETAAAQRYAAETDADSRQLLARAYSDVLRTDASAKADVHRQSAATRQAEIDRDMLRLQSTHQAPRPPARETCADLPATCITPAETCAPTCITPDLPVSVAAVVLSWLEAGIKAGDIQPGRYIRKTAPWSDRGELPESVRAEVKRRLATCQPPMIEAGTGGLYKFGPYGWVAARATVRGILSDL